MSIMNYPNLPLEVIEQIIDKVASKSQLPRDRMIPKKFDDLPSLKACALVCHSFLALCRKHIFALVILNGQRPVSPTPVDLNRLLSNSPHLAVYIRKLDYYIDNNKEFARKRPWLMPMFNKLVKLQRLRIGYSPTREMFNWMSPSGRKILLPLLHLPTLTSIRFRKIRNFSLADLAGCPNLKKINIGYFEFSTRVGKFLEPLPATQVKLEGFVTGDDDSSCLQVQRLCQARRPDGRRIIDFSSLKKLEVTLAQLDTLSDLFGMCRNLHHINLSFDPSRTKSIPSMRGLFTMLRSSLPTLVDIDIDYIITKANEKARDTALVGLCQEFEKMRGQNVVENINLSVWVPSGYDYMGWAQLDDVLMGSPEGWPELMGVFLSFGVTLTPEDDAQARDTSLLKLPPMTKLKESKLVQFNLDIAVYDPVA